MSASLYIKPLADSSSALDGSIGHAAGMYPYMYSCGLCPMVTIYEHMSKEEHSTTQRYSAVHVPAWSSQGPSRQQGCRSVSAHPWPPASPAQ